VGAERAEITCTEDGALLSWIGTVQDITESRRISEERLSHALQGANDDLWDWDWDWNLENAEVYYSPRWVEMPGYAEGELPQTIGTWAALVSPDERCGTLALVDDYVAGQSPKFEVEFRMGHQDGHWVDILSRSALARDSQGALVTPRRLFGTHVYISERKHIERLRQDSEANFCTFFDTIDDFLFVLGLNGVIQRVNRVLIERLGYPQVDLIVCRTTRKLRREPAASGCALTCRG
jgi:PAS domain-containing protein